MQTKLTLRLDDAVIRRAKAWARVRGVSLSEAVAAFFAQLPEESETGAPRVGPWARRLIGAAGPAPGDVGAGGVRRQHRDYLERKYA
jgi:Family of unknown function (DUF6364)